MAFELEASTIALEAFIHNIGERLELGDEQRHVIEDAMCDVPGDIAGCNSQAEASELLSIRLGECTGGSIEAQNAAMESIDFYWQIYNDSADMTIGE